MQKADRAAIGLGLFILAVWLLVWLLVEYKAHGCQ